MKIAWRPSARSASAGSTTGTSAITDGAGCVATQRSMPGMSNWYGNHLQRRDEELGHEHAPATTAAARRRAGRQRRAEAIEADPGEHGEAQHAENREARRNADRVEPGQA